MKPSRNTVNLIALLAIALSALILVQQRRSATPIQPVQVAQVETATLTNDEVAAAPARPRSVVRPATAVKPVAAATLAPGAVADGTSPVEMNDDAELAYQLGEDVSKMDAEAKARLRADWQAHVEEARVQAGAGAVQ